MSAKSGSGGDKSIDFVNVRVISEKGKGERIIGESGQIERGIQIQSGIDGGRRMEEADDVMMAGGETKGTSASAPTAHVQNFLWTSTNTCLFAEGSSHRKAPEYYAEMQKPWSGL